MSYTQTLIDLNAYVDSREYFNANINLIHNKDKWQYFSLTDIRSEDYNVDLNSFYSEHNLRYSLGEGKFKISYQGVHRSGQYNDKYRFGVIGNVSNLFFEDGFKKINTWYFINVHLIEFGRSYSVNVLPQIEHVYKVSFFKGKMYLGGFLDHNLIDNNNNFISKIVTEHQIGVHVIKSLFLVSEFRYNSFMSDPFGVSIGVEFVLK